MFNTQGAASGIGGYVPLRQQEEAGTVSYQQGAPSSLNLPVGVERRMGPTDQSVQQLRALLIPTTAATSGRLARAVVDAHAKLPVAVADAVSIEDAVKIAVVVPQVLAGMVIGGKLGAWAGSPEKSTQMLVGALLSGMGGVVGGIVSAISVLSIDECSNGQKHLEDLDHQSQVQRLIPRLLVNHAGDDISGPMIRFFSGFINQSAYKDVIQAGYRSRKSVVEAVLDMAMNNMQKLQEIALVPPEITSYNAPDEATRAAAQRAEAAAGDVPSTLKELGKKVFYKEVKWLRDANNSGRRSFHDSSMWIMNHYLKGEQAQIMSHYSKAEQAQIMRDILQRPHMLAALYPALPAINPLNIVNVHDSLGQDCTTDVRELMGKLSNCRGMRSPDGEFKIEVWVNLNNIFSRKKEEIADVLMADPSNLTGLAMAAVHKIKMSGELKALLKTILPTVKTDTAQFRQKWAGLSDQQVVAFFQDPQREIGNIEKHFGVQKEPQVVASRPKHD
jgi:hypothetical protein